MGDRRRDAKIARKIRRVERRMAVLERKATGPHTVRIDRAIDACRMELALLGGSRRSAERP